MLSTSNKVHLLTGNTVQLTRARSLQGLSLLQLVTLADLSGKPDKLLAVEDRRIAELATSIGAAWKEIESKAGFR